MPPMNNKMILSDLILSYIIRSNVDMAMQSCIYDNVNLTDPIQRANSRWFAQFPVTQNNMPWHSAQQF